MVDALAVRRLSSTFTVLASQTATATSSGTAAVRLPDIANGVYFLLDITALADVGGDLLLVTIQTSLGGTWIDAVAFTTVLGTTSPRKYLSDKIQADAAQPQINPATVLVADGVQHIIGDELRVRWIIVNNTAPSFTFSVVAITD